MKYLTLQDLNEVLQIFKNQEQGEDDKNVEEEEEEDDYEEENYGSSVIFLKKSLK